MAHGVLHRAQQRVRACPRPAPACSCASPVLRDSRVQGCQGIAWAALPGCCSSFSQGHSASPGQHFEDAAMCTAAVPLWMRLLLNEAG